MTVKMVKKPQLVMDATPKTDPTLCQCTGVQRRWDGDGIAERDAQGKYWYKCTACGKKYG